MIPRLPAFLFLSLLLAAMPLRGAAGAELFEAQCASCHGADGKGETRYGRERGIRDLASEEIQSETDDDLAAHAIECGHDVSADEARALVEVIRSFAASSTEPRESTDTDINFVSSDPPGSETPADRGTHPRRRLIRVTKMKDLP